MTTTPLDRAYADLGRAILHEIYNRTGYRVAQYNVGSPILFHATLVDDGSDVTDDAYALERVDGAFNDIISEEPLVHFGQFETSTTIAKALDASREVLSVDNAVEQLSLAASRIGAEVSTSESLESGVEYTEDDLSDIARTMELDPSELAAMVNHYTLETASPFTDYTEF